ncbi:hypothetical protein [Enterobacter mori]|uniref:hypothetical protein n=1 Tax=Enterobacter mori TaxID=539813 RepID=UPI003D6565C4
MSISLFVPPLLYLLLLIVIISLVVRYFDIKLNHKPLYKQGLFILSIALPLYSFLFFGFFCWRDYTPEFSQIAFDNFLQISKLPMLILATTVPLTAVVNNMHRTKQTEKQISNTEQQIAQTNNRNNINDYYSHHKTITERLEKITHQEIGISFPNGSTEYKSFTIAYTNKLYTLVFPNSTIENGPQLIPCEAFIEKIKQQWNEIKMNLTLYINIINEKYHSKGKSPQELAEWYTGAAQSLDISIKALCKFLQMKDYCYNTSVIMQVHNQKTAINFCGVKDLSKTLSELKNVTFKICDIMNVAQHDIEDIVQIMPTTKIINELKSMDVSFEKITETFE